MKRIMVFLAMGALIALLLPVGCLAAEGTPGTGEALDQPAGVENPATLSLEMLAQRNQKNRVISGSLGLLTGGLFMTAGVEDNPGVVSMGVGLSALSLADLIIKSSAEREYEANTKIADPQQREYKAYESLAYLAEMGKRSRLVDGVLFGAMAVYYSSLESDASYYYQDAYRNSMLVFGGMSLLSFAVPSYEESLYESVKKGKEQNYRLSLEIAPASVGLRVSCNF